MMSSLATCGVTSSNSDVKEDNDRLLATYPFNTNPIQSNRNRPAADPRVDSGASDLIGIINLCDNDISKIMRGELRSALRYISDTVVT
jgi:hypothetical protein